MRVRSSLGLVLAFLLAGCASPQATATSAPTIAIAATPAAASAPATSAAPASPSPSSGSVGAFSVCPTAAEGPLCPLPPGDYTVAVHDQFSFSISEAGWQEERQLAGEFATHVVLSRIDDPSQRMTFLSGQTGVASPAVVSAAAFAVAGFKAGQPTDVTVSETPAQYIDLEPSGATAPATVTVDSQSVTIAPDRRYRFTVAKIPMDQEAATVIVVAEAPVDKFSTFVTMSDKVVQSIKF
jgi:hypothetical protein